MEYVHSRHITTRDGVRLMLYDRPGPREGAPTLFLSNGLGGDLSTWRHLIAWFSPTHRIVSWDYRGLYGSALTDTQKAGGVALDVPAHTADAVEVADALGVERAVFIGWSMGVQLNFELVTCMPERIEGIVALSGGYGHALRRTMLGRHGERVIKPGMEVLRRVLELLGGPIGRAVDSDLLVGAVKRLGIVGRTLDDKVFRDLAKEFIRVDFSVYNRILNSLDDHDVKDVLPKVKVPVLIMAGDRDPMTPHWISERMARLVPAAELMILPGGTHYVPIEFPEMINLRVEKFLRARVGHPFQS